MKITKNIKPLAAGTVVVLPGGELLRIVEYIDAFSGVYKVQFLDVDGDDYVPVGDERVIPASDLVGAECE